MSTEWTRSAAGEGRAAMMRKGPTLCLDLRLHQDGEPPSPPQIYPQQQVTAPSLGVESMGQADPLHPTGEARHRHTPLETPGTSRSCWRNPNPALLLTRLTQSHTNGLTDSISRLVSRHDV